LRYELADHEWATIKPMLPNKPRGVRRVNDRRVLNGMFSCDLAHRGAICRTSSAPIPPATIASFDGVGLACGAGSWTQRLLLMMLPSK
jgi:transposase